MAEIEKVIRGLERCLKHTCPSIYSKEYRDCEYTTGLYCRHDKLMRDSIELLKTQPQIVRCEDCKNLDYTNHHWFCKYLNRCVDEDWFCADGERGVVEDEDTVQGT